MKVKYHSKNASPVEKFVHGKAYRVVNSVTFHGVYLCTRFGNDCLGVEKVQLVNVENGSIWNEKGISAFGTAGWAELECELHVIREI